MAKILLQRERRQEVSDFIFDIRTLKPDFDHILTRYFLIRRVDPSLRRDLRQARRLWHF